MRQCAQCGAMSSDPTLTCQRCGFSFQGEVESLQRLADSGSVSTVAPESVPSQKKKQRSFLIKLLWLFGIRYNPQTSSLGFAFVPTTISVAVVITVATAIVAGPVMELYPPFSNPAIAIGSSFVPGLPVTVHGKHFPPRDTIDFFIDGMRTDAVASNHSPTSQNMSYVGATVGLVRPLGLLTSSAKEISARDDGTFDAQIPIPTSWQPNSQHTIQARAIGSNGLAQAQVQQTVIMSGSGVPPDNANFRVNISTQEQYDEGYGPYELTYTLIVNGRKVCASVDTGQVQHSSGTLFDGQTPYTENATFSCSGTYKDGRITYTETLTSDVTIVNNQDTCNLLTPGPITQMSGSYTGQGNFSGTVKDYSFPQSAYSCSSFAGIVGGNGSWKGSVSA